MMQPVFQLVDLKLGEVVPAYRVVWSTHDSPRPITRDESGCLVKIKPESSGDVDVFIENVRVVLKQFADTFYGYSLAVPERGDFVDSLFMGVPSSAVFLRPDVLRAALTRDLSVLKDFVENYDVMDKDVLRGWNLFLPLGTKVILEFSGQWNEDVRRFVEEVFMEAVSGCVRELNDKRIYRVVFYPQEKFANYCVMDGVAFGFPSSMVMPEMFPDEIKVEWRALVDNVVEELKRMSGC